MDQFMTCPSQVFFRVLPMQLFRSPWQFFACICWLIGQPMPGTGVLVKDGCPLSRVHLTAWLRQTLSVAGFQGNFSSHSFGMGAATVAACNGVPGHRIYSSFGAVVQQWLSIVFTRPPQGGLLCHIISLRWGLLLQSWQLLCPVGAVHHCCLLARGGLRLH